MASGTIKAVASNSNMTTALKVFGDLNGFKKTTTYTDIDTLIDTECIRTSGGAYYYLFDNQATLFSGGGNRYQVMAWFSSDAKYGYAFIYGRGGVWMARRDNASTSTVSQLVLKSDLDNVLKWTLKDTKTGNAVIQLPTNFNELLVVSTNANMANDTRIAIIPKILCPTSGTITITQGATSATQTVSWGLTATTINLATWNVNSSTQINDCTTKVYYR